MSYYNVRGEQPVYRVTAVDYDGWEYQESMTAEGVVYTAEAGYLSCLKNQNVLVYLNTVTHGHGGNQFAEYVWAQTFPDAWAECGWLPNNFRMEFAGMGYISPLTFLAEQETPPEYEATGLVPDFFIEEAMPPENEATGQTEGHLPDAEATPPVNDAPLAEAEAPGQTERSSASAGPSASVQRFSETFDC